MYDLSVRRFLQSRSLAVVGGAMHRTYAGAAPAPPQFAEAPSFNPHGLYMSWQRDPTATMTIQWVGEEAAGAKRPVWYSKKGTQMWRTAEHAARRYPYSDSWIFRAELSGLEPGADYVFRIGTDSAEQRFRTM